MTQRISLEATITHRIGDIYFSKILEDLPSCPRVYRKFLPKDYEALITDEERTVNFICVGSPYGRGDKDNTDKSKLMMLLLKNIGKSLNMKNLKEGIGKSVISNPLRELMYDINTNSKCFNLSRSNRSPRTYTLEELELDEDEISDLKQLDIRLEIGDDPDKGLRQSLDSSML